jgi:uncharacterized protein YycO
MTVDYNKLRLGDCLLYSGNSPYSWLIKVKTWNKITHCEMYFVNGTTLASRDGQGVNFYAFKENPIKILRPKATLNQETLVEWFLTVQNQKYDWLGLLRFAYWDKIPTGHNNKMFCSEFLVRAYRAAGLKIFSWFDADAIAPWMFELINEFEDITLNVSSK